MDDRLAEIVAKQKAIEDRFMDLENMTLEDRNSKSQEMLLAIIAEVGEILNGESDAENADSTIKGKNGLKWKSWKTQQGDPDPEYIKTELSDILHFTLALMLIWKMDANEIYEKYMNKNKVNIKRYDSGY
jgi:NTP pyrophosphatase (non-canonical NTP hydrolase)